MRPPSRLRARLAANPLLGWALVATVLFHGALLASGTFRRTYDAYVHIFFADHYTRGWFETWEPRWYTGFTVTSYPPGTHQLVALGSRVAGLEGAFVLVQLAGMLLVVLGVYRVTLLLFGHRAAGMAAMLTVVSTSIAEAVHVFGQLPTVCALGLLLNSLPFVHRWIVGGDRPQLVAATTLLAGTTALHHVTTLFGAVFFLGPTVAVALLERFRTPHPEEDAGRPSRVGPGVVLRLTARRLRRVVRPLARAVTLGGLVAVVLLVIVLPYWVWSRTDPIVQIPIPHASRDDFLVDLNAGLVFWLIPWGPMLLAVPYALWRGMRSPTWPYAASLLVLGILGTGGTTPVPRALLGGAFDILTLDRFTFWATVLVLPYAGSLAADLFDGGLAGRLRRAFGAGTLRFVQAGLAVTVAVSLVFTVNLTEFRRMQPDRIDPGPIVNFLDKDRHSQWRYLTLGFGDQMAWLAAQTTAQSVDGNYHSARRLPELVSTPVERLEGAKFRGIAGLGSLQQFLAVPEKYHLKYVFSNDQFYDPLLYFSGWRTLQRLENGIVVWEREDVSPLPALAERPERAAIYGLMWGVLPPAALLAAAVGAAWSLRSGASRPRRRRSLLDRLETHLARWAPVTAGGHGDGRSWKEPLTRLFSRLQPSDRALRVTAAVVLAVVLAVAATALRHHRETSPEDTVLAYLDALDVRRFDEAWEQLDPDTRPGRDEYFLRLSVEDGLLDSYASLDAVEIRDVQVVGSRASVTTEVVYVTSLAEFRTVETFSLRRRSGGGWGLELPPADPTEAVERLARRTEVVYAAAGRRTVTTGTTEYRDIVDRPELEVGRVRVVMRDGVPAVVGSVRNVDADPAGVTVTAQLLGGSGEVAAWYNARQVIEHSLLPGEFTPYRVDFEGVAGLGGDVAGTFHPADFTPLGPIDDIAATHTYAKAVVTTRGLQRPLALQGLAVASVDGVPVLSGEILNLGSEPVTVTALLVSFYDPAGALIWVDWILVPDAVRPGLAQPFEVRLTAHDRLTVIDVPTRDYANGLPAEPAPFLTTGQIPVLPETGFSAISVTPVAFTRGGA